MEGKEAMKWDASALKELDDSAIQKKIDYEVRMRDGTVRLLSASHEEAQALEASKNLHTINSRILALMSLLQRHRAKSVNKRVRQKKSSLGNDEEDGAIEPCKAKVSLSDIRIPLMWTQDDHQKAKTEQHIYYVFCLLKMDGQVLDTSMVETDESETDVTFDDIIVFENVSSDFKLDLEIYYTVSSDSAANRNAHTKKHMKWTSSSPEAMKFVLAGHTHLNVDHLDDKIKTYDLKTGLVGASFSATTVSTEEVHAPELALWGQVCCRLAARPDSIGVDKMKGFLDVQCLNNGRNTWSKMWCVLRHSFIACWENEADEQTIPPTETIEIKMNMEIKDSLTPTLKDKHIIILASPSHEKEPVISTETREDFMKWKMALEQTILNVTAWRKACKTEMKIENPSSRKVFLPPKKLYDAVEVTLSPLADVDPNLPVSPQPELALLEADMTDVKCTYDIWQRRKPENSSFRNGKNGSTVPNFESTI